MISNEISCGIVVFHNKEFLILHYEEGHWDLPKGHVENNETHEETALRETKEETGLDIKIIPGFKEQISYSFEQDNKIINKKVYFFVGKSNTKTVRLSDEHIGYEWLKYEEALNKVTYDTARRILKKAHEFLVKHKLY